MLADAGMALADLSESSPWHAAALHMRGSAALLLDAAGEAEELLTAAAAAAESHGCAETQMIAFAQLSLLARDREDYEQAEALAAQALAVAARAELLGCPSYALALAASAHAALRHGRWAEARELVSAAEPLGAGITEALPWLAVAARVELGRC
jgi:LuxR family maltose regulon positive regulatory protein